MGRNISEGRDGGVGVRIGAGTFLGQTLPLVSIGSEVYLHSGFTVPEDDAPDVPASLKMRAAGGWSVVLLGSESATPISVHTDNEGNWAAAFSGNKFFRSLDDAVTWTPTGPTQGGCMAIAPGGVMYVGGNNGALSKSVNYGASFSPLSITGIGMFHVHCLGAAGGVVLACVSVGDEIKIMRSTDGGATFASVALPGNLKAEAGGVHSLDTDGNGLWLATLVNRSGQPDAYPKLLRSADNGNSWSISNILPALGGASQWRVSFDKSSGSFYIYPNNNTQAGVRQTNDGIAITVCLSGAYNIIAAYEGVFLGVNGGTLSRYAIDSNVRGTAGVPINAALALVARGCASISGTWVAIGLATSTTGSSVIGISRSSVESVGILKETAGLYMRIK